MGFLLLAAAVALAIVPAGIAIGGTGVPPKQGILFASTQLTLAAMAIGIACQNRYRIWMQSTGHLSRMCLRAAGASAALLIGYLFAYNLCVIQHPLYRDKI